MAEYIYKEKSDGFGVNIQKERELVRCKDCKYGAKLKNAKGESMIECGLMYDDAWLKDPDWFCADGERKET